MKYEATLLVVKDIDKSVAFYRDILNQEVICDYGANKTLTGGFSLQTLDTWRKFIDSNSVTFSNNASELYFEEDDFDVFIDKLNARKDIRYVHNVKEHNWGQRVVRIFDPDDHIIEIGENMKNVAKKFQKSGMSEEEMSARMDISLYEIRQLLK